MHQDARRFAHQECKRLRGYNQKMDEVEILIEMSEGDIRNLNIYAETLLDYLIAHLEYEMEHNRRMSDKAKERCETIIQSARNIMRNTV